VTARDRCSLFDAACKEVIGGMQQASAANTVRVFIASPHGDDHDGE
jgi:hypothetical protein